MNQNYIHFNPMIMSTNIESVNSIYEAFGNNDVPAILDYLADNVQWEPWPDNYAQNVGVPWLLERNGKEGAQEFFKIVGTFIFKDFRVVSVMGNGNQVAVECIIEADIPSSGGHLSDDEIHLWTFDEQGKVIRFRHYCDTAKHIAASRRTH